MPPGAEELDHIAKEHGLVARRVQVALGVALTDVAQTISTRLALAGRRLGALRAAALLLPTLLPLLLLPLAHLLLILLAVHLDIRLVRLLRPALLLQ